MSGTTIANLKKTISYFKRNGLRDTYLAALERLQKNPYGDYQYTVPDADLLETQKKHVLSKGDPLFGILVPTYQTDETFLRAMVDSVLEQTYEKWELILADASGDDSVKKVIDTYEDDRIRYVKLPGNNGISENTNGALDVVTGDYIGLLDHDDVLTPDALYEMAQAIRKAKEKGVTLKLLYSDEDKCDESGAVFYEPHFKQEFNLDLILSNNYICHFTVMEASLMKKLRFRKEFDGAQDHDLVLRAIGEILRDQGGVLSTKKETEICHIKSVLYHWRCHRGSTAANPESKRYAYEAGKRAVQDFLRVNGIPAQVESSRHLGFFSAEYEPDLLSARADVGISGGRLQNRKNKITGGIYEADGTCSYQGLPTGFSGYMHRASLQQGAYAVDVRNMLIRPALHALVSETAKRYLESIGKKEADFIIEGNRVNCEGLCLTEQEYRALSICICEDAAKEGYRVVWSPDLLVDLSEVTLVVPNYNGLDYLKKCLETLSADIGSGQAKILVVDNGSEDGSTEWVKENHPEVELLALPENTGFCHAVNVGIRQSKTPYVILLNNDTEVKPGFTKALLKAILQSEKIFSVSSKMLDMKNETLVDNAGDLYCALGWAFARGKGKRTENFEKPVKVFSACGGASIYRKAAFEKIGYFDELHFAYLEDVDIGWRAKIYGYRNLYEPSAQVLHAGSAASGSKYNAFKANLSSANSVYIIGKNMPLLQWILNLPFLLLGFVVKQLFFVRKKMGKIYAKGCLRGLLRCFSREGRAQKVPFRWRHVHNYVLIQFQMWINIFRRMIQK